MDFPHSFHRYDSFVGSIVKLGSEARLSLFPRKGAGFRREKVRILDERKQMSTAELVNKLTGSTATTSQDTHISSSKFIIKSNSNKLLSSSLLKSNIVRTQNTSSLAPDFTEGPKTDLTSKRKVSPLNVLQMDSRLQSSQDQRGRSIDTPLYVTTTQGSTSNLSTKVRYTSSDFLKQDIPTDRSYGQRRVVSYKQQPSEKSGTVSITNPYRKSEGTENYLKLISKPSVSATKKERPHASFFVVSRATNHRSKRTCMLEARVHE